MMWDIAGTLALVGLGIAALSLTVKAFVRIGFERGFDAGHLDGVRNTMANLDLEDIPPVARHSRPGGRGRQAPKVQRHIFWS